MELNQRDQIQIGEGWVWHSRPSFADQKFGFWGRLFGRTKLVNSFRYPIFNLLIPLHSEGALKKLQQRRFLSVPSENYLNSLQGSLQENISDFLNSEFQYSCDQVWLQTLPSLFGYAFNPVSFWYCYKAGKLDAVVCEVNNTFGDRHFYFIRNLELNSSTDRKATKRFHVSPFMDISGYYVFDFDVSEASRQVRIRLFDSNENLKLDTLIKLSLSPFDQISLSYILKKYGWITFMVIWRIHFQALKLWLKGAKFYKRPTPPQRKITYDSASF